MDASICTLPVELLTIIAIDDFDSWINLLKVPVIGLQLCAQYPQLIAKAKFITTTINRGGDKMWYLNGKLHRIDGPAVEWANGYKAWYKYNKRHRDDGPAIIYVNGHAVWYKNDKMVGIRTVKK